MTHRTPTRIAAQLLVFTAVLAALLTLATPAAKASAPNCPSPDNMDIATYFSSGTYVFDIDWSEPIDAYTAAVLCSDVVVGYDVRNANGESVYRREWTAAELFIRERKSPNLINVLPSFGPRGSTIGCEWSVILYSRPLGDEYEDWFERSETVYADRWGTRGCKRISDIVGPSNPFSFAPVVSENPPSIDP